MTAATKRAVASKRATASKRASTKRADKKHRVTVRASNHPHMTYESTHTTFTSHPAKGEPFGVRTTVVLKNGEGATRLEHLDRNGATLRSTSKPIHNSHFHKVRNGKYVPGLWGV